MEHFVAKVQAREPIWGNIAPTRQFVRDLHSYLRPFVNPPTTPVPVVPPVLHRTSPTSRWTSGELMYRFHKVTQELLAFGGRLPQSYIGEWLLFQKTSNVNAWGPPEHQILDILLENERFLQRYRQNEALSLEDINHIQGGLKFPFMATDVAYTQRGGMGPMPLELAYILALQLTGIAIYPSPTPTTPPRTGRTQPRGPPSLQRRGNRQQSDNENPRLRVIHTVHLGAPDYPQGVPEARCLDELKVRRTCPHVISRRYDVTCAQAIGVGLEGIGVQHLIGWVPAYGITNEDYRYATIGVHTSDPHSRIYRKPGTNPVPEARTWNEMAAGHSSSDQPRGYETIQYPHLHAGFLRSGAVERFLGDPRSRLEYTQYGKLHIYIDERAPGFGPLTDPGVPAYPP